MNRIELKKLAEDGLRVARRLVEEQQHDQLVPVFVIMDDEKRLHIVGTPFTDDDQKNRIAAAMRVFMREKNAVAYVFISEVWAKSYNKGTPRDQLVPPSKCEDRKEMVYAVAESDSGDQLGICAEIMRDANNRRSLGEFEYPDLSHYSGRFTGLLD